jgi:hypothetical protein
MGENTNEKKGSRQTPAICTSYLQELKALKRQFEMFID